MRTDLLAQRVPMPSRMLGELFARYRFSATWSRPRDRVHGTSRPAPRSSTLRRDDTGQRSRRPARDLPSAHPWAPRRRRASPARSRVSHPARAPWTAPAPVRPRQPRRLRAREGREDRAHRRCERRSIADVVGERLNRVVSTDTSSRRATVAAGGPLSASPISARRATMASARSGREIRDRPAPPRARAVRCRSTGASNSARRTSAMSALDRVACAHARRIRLRCLRRQWSSAAPCVVYRTPPSDACPRGCEATSAASGARIPRSNDETTIFGPPLRT